MPCSAPVALNSSPDWKFKNVCVSHLGGDTNINEAVDGNVQLPRDWQAMDFAPCLRCGGEASPQDAWLVLKPEDPGWRISGGTSDKRQQVLS